MKDTMVGCISETEPRHLWFFIAIFQSIVIEQSSMIEITVGGYVDSLLIPYLYVIRIINFSTGCFSSWRVRYWWTTRRRGIFWEHRVSFHPPSFEYFRNTIVFRGKFLIVYCNMWLFQQFSLFLLIFARDALEFLRSLSRVVKLGWKRMDPEVYWYNHGWLFSSWLS